MALENRLTQEQALIQQQQQRLTAQQLLQVKLLEMPLAQLEENIKVELYENPALESANPDDNDNLDPNASLNESDGMADGEEEDFDTQSEREDREDALDSALDSIDSDDRMASDYRAYGDSNQTGAEQEEMVYGDTASFYDKLMEQVSEEELTDDERQIMEYLIGSLDNDGFLRSDVAFISDNLAIYQGLDVTEKDVQRVLQILQGFDPAGIGASSLQECLLLQIARREDSRLTRRMRKVIRNFFDDFTKKHWEKIRQHLKVTEYEAEEVIKELRKLNPRPGASLGETMGRSAQQVTPDFIIDTDENGIVTMTLNSGELPQLFISRDFEQQMLGYQNSPKSLNRMEKEALLYTKEKVERARGYIEAIERRRQTLTLTMQAIIKMQHKYFVDGDESDLVPMTMTDIADKIGMDVSTVSRVCNAKYAETPWGIFKLRHFFSSGFSVAGEEEMSNRKIKAALSDIVKAEDPKHPLSDDSISKELKKQGFPVARRTVAKYREALGIPVARLRK
ncbi:MAG: RNA polymerase factor sigma-54 [Prevotellaceae bacterium]|nr:RNA polymerase factor sigma-54 [Prevotellaceae bacterium]